MTDGPLVGHSIADHSEQQCIWCGAAYEATGIYKGYYCEDCRPQPSADYDPEAHRDDTVGGGGLS